MGVRREGWVVSCFFASVVAVPGLNASQTHDAAERARAHQEAAATTAAADTRGAWPRVQIADPVAAKALRAALNRAWALLGEPQCSRVLRDFSDGTGQSLERRLASLEVPVQEYLTRLVFIDDSRNRRCVTGVLGFTEPGSRVVRLCVNEFKRVWLQDQQHTIAAVIHEMLHTLGLGENPPSSNEITKRVRSICVRR